MITLCIACETATAHDLEGDFDESYRRLYRESFFQCLNQKNGCTDLMVLLKPKRAQHHISANEDLVVMDEGTRTSATDVKGFTKCP